MTIWPSLAFRRRRDANALDGHATDAMRKRYRPCGGVGIVVGRPRAASGDGFRKRVPHVCIGHVDFGFLSVGSW